MAQDVVIKINPKFPPDGNKAANFDPQTATAMAGDLVYWRSYDRNSIHQPKPVGGADDAWVKNPIPTMLDDQPVSSNTVSFGTGTNKSGVPYVCAKHPGETGTIIVLNNVNINSKPGANTTPEANVPQVAFAPPKLQLVVNEGFIWTNNDVNAHWPAPSGGPQTAWLQQAIPPGQTSAVVSFAQTNTGIPYVCALHPNETGTIVVNPSA